jgi:hypothetical protein
MIRFLFLFIISVGWIASYVILAGLTDSHAKAAYINAVFFMTLSFGRLLAIILAVWVSTCTIVSSSFFVLSVAVSFFLLCLMLI